MLTATSNNGNDAYSDGMDELAWYTSAETPSPMATTTGRVEQNFPTVLHHVLAQLEREGKAHIAGFLSHGRAFKVFKPREFVDEVLTPWFRQTKYSSFQRQLNIYGFTRISTGIDANAYYHKFFVRGRHELVSRIQRVPVKGPGRRRLHTDTAAPNFYTMPAVATSTSLGATRHTKEETLFDSYTCGRLHNIGDHTWPTLQKEEIQGNNMEGRHGSSTRKESVTSMHVVLASGLSRRQRKQKQERSLLLEAIALRQRLAREELRLQLEQRLAEENRGGPTIPNVLREALFSLRNATL